MSLKRTGTTDSATETQVVNGIVQVYIPDAPNQVAGPIVINQQPAPVVAYHHIQNVSSNSWVIQHNLGFYPNVTAVDSTGTIVEGEIAYSSIYELTVYFTDAFSGHAYLS